MEINSGLHFHLDAKDQRCTSDIYTMEASAYVKPTLEDERKLKQVERSVEKNADSLSYKR